ncbi:serine hydrolase domain-containing protein [Aquimarina pacifica]|uniref:serine hydrolase domain-containing protein n=1 Tax=Aquimarina pacifica TaxID=1296415 RepID=UPI000472E26D|nr:serine hydrolase domain-containing protein [Aquimarina pacifica]
MNKFYLFTFLLAIVSCSKPEEPISVQEDPMISAKKDTFVDFLHYYEQFFKANFNPSGCPGAALVIVKDSTVVYKKGFGVKEIHTQDSVDVNTVFRIASLSKGVTAILAGTLVDREELQWDQLVKESVAQFNLRDTQQANRIEVNHLLSHTTGLYQYTHTKLIHRGMSLGNIIPRFRYAGVIAKEGVDYEYQNAAFSIIEKVFEAQTTKNFDELIKERLFIPAGMQNASSTYDAITQNNNVALPHSFNQYSKKYKKTSIHRNYYNVAAAGGVNASISDMGEYLKVLLGNRPDIISKQTLASVFNPFICTSLEESYVNNWDGVTDSYYAKGWRILDYRGRRIVYHGGNVNQYKSELLVDPENSIAICVLFNAPNRFNPVVIPTFLNYYDYYKSIVDD